MYYSVCSFAGLETLQTLRITTVVDLGKLPNDINCSICWSNAVNDRVWDVLRAVFNSICWSCNLPLLQLRPSERSGLLELGVRKTLKCELGVSSLHAVWYGRMELKRDHHIIEDNVEVVPLPA